MPGTYKSFLITPDMTLAEKQVKLFLGVSSAEEQAYTLGAAIGECRKQLSGIDELVRAMKHDLALLQVEAEKKA